MDFYTSICQTPHHSPKSTHVLPFYSLNQCMPIIPPFFNEPSGTHLSPPIPPLPPHHHAPHHPLSPTQSPSLPNAAHSPSQKVYKNPLQIPETQPPRHFPVPNSSVFHTYTHTHLQKHSTYHTPPPATTPPHSTPPHQSKPTKQANLIPTCPKAPPTQPAY